MPLMLFFFIFMKVSHEDDIERTTIPYNLPWDDMPLDLSFIFDNEKPAGKHGFLWADGDRFVFEDGTEARFWGTTFNGTHNFPLHQYSEMVAGPIPYLTEGL